MYVDGVPFSPLLYDKYIDVEQKTDPLGNRDRHMTFFRIRWQ